MGTPIDSSLLSIIVHDLRTPLNVIGLSLRMIEQLLGPQIRELAEDVEVVQANVNQLDEMLATLGDYGRVLEDPPKPGSIAFDPGRLVAEEVEYRIDQARHKNTSIHVRDRSRAPREAYLNEPRARLAIRYALSNALTSSNGAPVQVDVEGGPHRWRTWITIEAPPPQMVEAVTLRSDLFERLKGNSSCRLGLELAVVALISEQLGGSARLDVSPGQDSTILLDWPVATQPKAPHSNGS